MLSLGCYHSGPCYHSVLELSFVPCSCEPRRAASDRCFVPPRELRLGKRRPGTARSTSLTGRVFISGRGDFLSSSCSTRASRIIRCNNVVPCRLQCLSGNELCEILGFLTNTQAIAFGFIFLPPLCSFDRVLLLVDQVGTYMRSPLPSRHSTRLNPRAFPCVHVAMPALPCSSVG